MFRWIKRFKWDSPDQHYGYLGFLSWAKRHKVSAKVRPIDLFFIQKDHDSHVYWLEMVATQNAQMRLDILKLQEKIFELEKKVPQ